MVLSPSIRGPCPWRGRWPAFAWTCRRQVHAKAGHRPRQGHGPRIEGDKTMKTTYTPFDVAEYLDTDEAIAEYLTATLEDGNPDVFLAALGDVAKARGMAQIA